MKIARVRHQGRVSYALIEGDEALFLKGFPAPEPIPVGERVPLEETVLLAPCTPSKIIALGLNYKDHAQELGLPLPQEPLIFLKPPSALIGPGEKIVLPTQSKRVDYEGELAVVIGRRAKDVSLEEALDYVLGYTCFNDVTARDLQKRDGQWTRAKSFDTFAPCGPWIETSIDPTNLKIETFLNGEKRQSSSTRELVFSVPEIISFISQIMTLWPGDIIATGTPPGIGPLKSGDTIEISIQHVGKLTNQVL